jgi:hypothetical protein
MLEVCLEWLENKECSGLFFAPKEGVTNCSRCPGEELAIETIERVFAPEGHRTSFQS